MRRTLNLEEFDEAAEMLAKLTEILLEVGVVELKISKKDREIYWDTQHGGEINPSALHAFAEAIDRHYYERTAT